MAAAKVTSAKGKGGTKGKYSAKGKGGTKAGRRGGGKPARTAVRGGFKGSLRISRGIAKVGGMTGARAGVRARSSGG